MRKGTRRSPFDGASAPQSGCVAAVLSVVAGRLLLSAQPMLGAAQSEAEAEASTST